MYHQINKGYEEGHNSLRKKFKLLCIICAFVMYFVLLFNNSFSASDNGQHTGFHKGRNPKFQSLLFEEDASEFSINLATQNKEELEQQKNKILQLKKRKNTIHYYINGIINNIPSPSPYRNITSVPKIKQLPFCIVALSSPAQILSSIESQDYSSFKMIYFKGQLPKASEKTVLIKNHNSFLPLTDQLIYYYCGIQSIILIAQQPLKQQSLNNLNNLYQKNNIWLTYDKVDEQNFSVSSFYGHIFINLKKNDFSKQKTEQLNSNINFIILSMLELTKFHASSFPDSDIFLSKKPFFQTKIQTVFQSLKNHEPYQPLFSLSQNYQINEQQLAQNYKKLLENKTNGYIEQGNINQEQMLQAIEYLELKNLPENHSLFDRQKIYYTTKYKLGRSSNQIPFCIVVVSSDNIENSRYEKVIQSINSQHYDNYHVVFIDDNSKDQTFFQTKKYILDHHFDPKKFSYIKNRQKKPYLDNIKNAAYNYCKSSDVMMLVDGDDELIGRYVFKLINFRYLMRNNWVVYTNAIDSSLHYGDSKPVNKNFFSSQSRNNKYVMGQLKTFYIDLFKKISDKDLKDNDKKYFQTDIPMQYPMFEMSGPNHVEYLPEVCYFKTGNNSEEKLLDFVLQKEKYQQIDYVYNTM